MPVAEITPPSASPRSIIHRQRTHRRQNHRRASTSLRRGETMNSSAKLSCAIAAILGGNAASPAYAADAADTSPSDTIQEITVTAQRRTENMQDVPITIQALTAETLTQLNVTTFDDFVEIPAECHAGEQRSGPGHHIHARFERRGRRFGRGRRAGQRHDRSVPECRGIPRRSVGIAPGAQSRHLRRGHRAHRGARGASGHAVRLGRRGRRAALHHQ